MKKGFSRADAQLDTFGAVLRFSALRKKIKSERLQISFLLKIFFFLQLSASRLSILDKINYILSCYNEASES